VGSCGGDGESRLGELPGKGTRGPDFQKTRTRRLAMAAKKKAAKKKAGKKKK
jgi:hypothetical protein